MAAEKQAPSWALRLNILTLRFARNWLGVVLVFLGVYVSLPFVAPTLMKLGIDGPGRVIYTLYAPFCHQFAFRSFFLYGDQPVYPRASASTHWFPIESYIADDPDFAIFTQADEFTLDWTLAYKNFMGNDRMGYKVALCERDIFIWLAMFSGGLIYAIPVVRRRLRPVPIWLYVFLGLLPIALDGFSQLLGYPPFDFWPPRETIPTFRILTGGLFGLMNIWLAFPYLDRSLHETRRQLEAKLARADVQV